VKLNTAEMFPLLVSMNGLNIGTKVIKIQIKLTDDPVKKRKKLNRKD